MSDSDDDCPPPSRGLATTGHFRRPTVCMPSNSTSSESPSSPASSFRWDTQQSFRLYATKSMANHRKSTFMLAGSLSDLGVETAPTPSVELSAAYKQLKDYIVANGQTTVSHDSQLPVNIKKGKFIGSGGFAQVYCGINVSSGELVAIKEIQVTGGSRAELAAVEQEFALLRALKHTNVVRYLLFEHSVSQKVCRIVMEFMAGGSTQTVCQKFGPLSEAILKKYTKDIFSGLAFIHEHGIIHRDIKSANLLVSGDGTVKLADFGCSKRITEISSATSFVIGTPIYMSPEFIRGDTSPKIDVWAAGCTIFELATGLQPWHHTRIKDHLPLMYHITTSSDTPLMVPTSDPRTFSAEFLDFLEKCFLRDPLKRPDAKTLLEHPWLDSTLAELEEQREIEEATYVTSADNCHTLSSVLLDLDIPEVDVTNSNSAPATRSPGKKSPRAFGQFGRQPSTASGDIPSGPVSPQLSNIDFGPGLGGSVGSIRFGFGSQSSAQPSVAPQNQVLVLGEKGSLEMHSYSEETGDDTPFTEPLSLPTPDGATQMTLSGPVRMNFSFQSGGKNVDVGLEIAPSDVSLKVVDRRPSFVVAMNEHIRGQINDAMLKFFKSEGEQQVIG